MSELAARNKAAIAGFAQSPILRHAPMTLGALTVATVREAIADAGLEVSDIDGLITTPLFPSLGSHAAEDGIAFVTTNWLAQRMGLSPGYQENPQGQLPGAVAMAVNAIHAGVAKNVVVYRSLYNPGGSYHQNDAPRAVGRDQWTMPQGHHGPIAAIAMAWNEYAQRYGADDDALAPIAIEARKNGARLPWSYWKGKPLTLEQYLAAPFINDPIRMFDCDIPVDGAAAFVITSAERARDLPHKPVCITAYADMLPRRVGLPMHWPYDEIMELGALSLERLCQRGDVRLSDIDHPQIYDGFAPLSLFWIELLGLAPRGEAHRFIAESGIDSDSPGGKAVLASGGSLGNGRMHGTPQMIECYLQLSRRAGERQRDVSLALACQGLPNMGGTVLYSASD
jgi:acetyl-CoA acetyltransferase